MKNTVIFTNLEGTLLDAVSYSYAPAQPALKLIAAGAMPLILCSSKTRAELEVCRTRLHNAHPFIAENGAGIFIPKEYFSTPVDAKQFDAYQLIALGIPCAEIRGQFVRLREKSGAKVLGFGDMSIAEVAKLTGLSEAEAALAKQCDFDEPFVFDGEADEGFLHAIEASGLRWTQGRIFHIMGHHDKGRAVDILMALYRQEYGDVTSIGLGDSLNDLPMLMAVDQPVLVRRNDGSFDQRISIPHLLKTRSAGPSGWNEALMNLLSADSGKNVSALLVRQNMMDILDVALAAVDPYHAVLRAARVEQQYLHVSGAVCDLHAYDSVIVVGAGKATARMALAIEHLLQGNINAGLIIVKDGRTEPLSVIEQIESSHPVPGEAGVSGTRRVLEMAHAATEKTLIICLLSGGASALLVAPGEGLTLQDKQETTQLLLNAGASIFELNAVRKHLSAVKGGRLAQAAYPAQLLTLVVSDVVGDPPDVIASGPTVPDSSTFADAWAVILKYGLLQKLPHSVIEYLRQGAEGQQPETVKANNPCLGKTRNVIIASIHQALAAAHKKSMQSGFATRIVSDTLQGEAREVARFIAQAARTELATMQVNERHCLLFGGETTVRVNGSGKGGRNQELALAFALETEGWQGVALLSAGTDGTDGPTDAAGAMVDTTTALRARSAGIDPARYLANNDSYTFFQDFAAECGEHCHIKTGPTGTNVMDIQIVLLNTDYISE